MRNCLKITALLCALMLVHFKGHSQCTKVCGTITSVSSGTTSVTGSMVVTNTVPVIVSTPKGNYTITTTYSYVTTTGLNSITAGALSVSVSNVGNDNALFNAATIPPGATVNIEIPNAVLPSYTYNCLTSSLVVLVNR